MGVAKSLLHVDGLPGEREVRAAVAAARGAAAPQVAPAGAAQGPQGVADARPLPGGGCWLPLAGARGEEHGAALCAHGAGGSGPISPRAGPPAAARPIYVSVGHRIGLTSALAVVQRCCKHRFGGRATAASARPPIFTYRCLALGHSSRQTAWQTARARPPLEGKGKVTTLGVG